MLNFLCSYKKKSVSLSMKIPFAVKTSEDLLLCFRCKQIFRILCFKIFCRKLFFFVCVALCLLLWALHVCALSMHWGHLLIQLNQVTAYEKVLQKLFPISQLNIDKSVASRKSNARIEIPVKFNTLSVKKKKS